MAEFIRRLLYAAGGAIVLMLVNGCQTDKIAVTYSPQTNVTLVKGADRVPVKISVEDARPVKWVGFADESNQFGDNTWHINATNDLAALLKNSVGDELAHRGFKLSDNGATLKLRLNTIYAHSFGKGKVVLSVEVIQSDGSILYSELITGKGHSNPFAHYDDGKIIKIALDEALEDCITRLFANQSFINSLLKSSG